MSVTSWCGGHQLDPVNCPIGTVLEYLQACSSTGLTHSTLKVYVGALLAYHAPLAGQSVGRHPLETSFLQSLRPPAREVCCVRMLFHSLESSDLPSSWGSTHFSEVGLRDAGPAHFSFSAGRRGLLRRSTEFVTGRGQLFCWLTRCVVFIFQCLGTLYRSVVSSQAPFRVVPLEDIFIVAGCSSPLTFIRFYNLDLDMAPRSRFLSVWTSHRCYLVLHWARFVNA